MGQTRIQEIENEARMSKLLEEHKHPNIVTILGHGWIKNSGSVFFIDMELCDMSLIEYIRYLKGEINTSSTGRNIAPSQQEYPSLIQADMSCECRVHNMWAIASQVAQGIAFLLSHKQVHRDITPKNSMVLTCFC
jgi:serine/threonine protein kinase